MTIQRRFNRFKYFIKEEEKLSQEMEKIQDRLNKMKWTEETYLERIRLYQQLGRMMEYHRMDRVTIKWYHEKLLENAILTR